MAESKTPQPNLSFQDVLGAGRAQGELERSGSVMADFGSRLPQTGNVLMDMLLRMAVPAALSNEKVHQTAQSAMQGRSQLDPALQEEMMNFVNPMAGVFGPIRTAGQKHAAKALFRADPELTQQIAKSPRQMNIRVPQGKPGQSLPGDDPLAYNFGTFQEINPALGEVALNPNVMRGKTPFGEVDPVLADVPSTLLHEALHFLNAPEIAKKNPEVAEQLAILLQDFVAPHGRKQIRRELFDKRPLHAFNEALSWLGESAFANKRAASKAAQAAMEAGKNVSEFQRGHILDSTLQRLAEVTKPEAQNISIMELVEQFSPQAARTKKMSDALKSAPAKK